MRSIGHIAGMPAEPIFPVKKLVSLTQELAARISEFRFEQRIRSENEAIRRLIELGLRAAQGGAEKPAKAQGR